MAGVKVKKNTHVGQNMIERPKNFKKSWASLTKYCKKYLWIFALAILLAVAGTVLSLIGPNKIGDLGNLISSGMFSAGGIDLTKVSQIAYFLVTIYLLSAVFSYSQGFIMVTVTQKLSKKLRADICKKINRLPLKYLDRHSYGDVLSRVTNDVDTITSTLSYSIADSVTAIVMIIGCAIMMFITNWIMALTAIAASIIGFSIMAVIMKQSQKYFVMQQRDMGELNGQIEETYSGHNVIKAYNAEKQVLGKFNTINQKLCKNTWKSQFFSGLMMPLMAFVGNLGFVAVCVVGAVICSQGMIDIGVVISFMIYVRLFSSPLSTLAQAATSLQSTAAASERVFEILNEEELTNEDNKKIKLENITGKVEFKNVKFGYDEGKTIIHNLSAVVKPGQKVAIVGPTGAGKTTLVNLLMRFYEVDDGQILIDDVPTSELTRENIHALFGMVLQDTWLFEGTIKDNVAYSKKNVTSEQVKQACETVGVDHFIKTLPRGYETILNDNTSVSAGQKQLLTIARAMIEDAPMLILDEATSSVDTRTEQLIQKAMDKLMKGRTTFVIAHRLSTIKNADLILVMKDGNVIEKGTHRQLMAQDGFYKELYNSQFTSKNAEVIEID